MKRSIKFFSCRGHGFTLLTGGLIALYFLSCTSNLGLDGPKTPLLQTPWEAYLSALDSNGLANTQMVKAWRSVGLRALSDSVLVEAPFQETGYLQATTPAAPAYRLKLKEGEVLEIELTTKPDSTLFFVDLFQVEVADSSSNYRHLFHAENYRTDSLTFEAPKAGTYLLRIQPELLVSCRFTLRLIVQPVYGVFPVKGKGNRDIWSFFGDTRDGGKRDHQGIDIFAGRGTPVVAAVDGVIRSVRDRGLGGKQVWLNDPLRQQSLYYAHLDTQLVREGQQVRAGDTLGLVGNTGNARNTRPHLHFGIYRRSRGAVDPHPFIASQSVQAPGIQADTALLGQPARVRRGNTRLMAAPGSRGIELATLERHLPLQVVAVSKTWYRVNTSQGLSGYLPANSLEAVDRAIRSITLTESIELLQSPHPDAAPVAAVSSETELAVLGTSGTYQLVRDTAGTMGWMLAAMPHPEL